MKKYIYLIFPIIIFIGCEKENAEEVSILDSNQKSVEQKEGDDVKENTDVDENSTNDEKKDIVEKEKVETDSSINNWTKITSIINYDSDDVTEDYKISYSFDSLGRETGFSTYSKGNLILKYRDYSYIDNTIIAYADSYLEGKVTSSYKTQRVFRSNFTDIVSVINYDSDNVTEDYKISYSFDSLGRETGFSTYSKGDLILNYRDYSYADNTIIAYVDSYSEGKITSSYKTQRIFRSNFTDIVSVINYGNDDVTEDYKILYSFDSLGRETGFSTYSKGDLILNYRDYSYTDNTITAYADSYSGGKITSSYKTQRTYLNK